MGVDRWHAFAEGTTFPSPAHLMHLPKNDPHRVAGQIVWDAFRAVAIVSDTALLGPYAWPINLRNDRSALSIGHNSVVRGIIRVERQGHVSIGDHCYVGDEVILSAHVGIDIQDEVLIAHGCQIFDNVSHPIDASERAAHYKAILGGAPFSPNIPAEPVTIQRSAWLGFNSIVMKGVNIARGSIVAAGSVVVHSTEPDTIVAGNPARSVRAI